MRNCVIYLRTSSATNVGEKKDSDKRQRLACSRYAAANKYHIAEEFYDADVKGTLDHLERPGFSALVEFCAQKDIDTVICETHERFSRDLIVQEKGYVDMKEYGLTIIPTNNPEMFLDDTTDPTRTLIRQMLGALSQYEKTSIILKLRGARERKRVENKKLGIRTISGDGKCGGRLRYSESENDDEAKLVSTIKRLRRKPRNGTRLSIRGVTDELNKLGFRTKKGTEFHHNQIKRILDYA